MPKPTSKKDNKNEKTVKSVDSVNQMSSKEVSSIASSVKDRLLVEIEQLGARLPRNVIDQIIDELGGPNNVADLTGRRCRLVEKDGDQVRINIFIGYYQNVGVITFD